MAIDNAFLNSIASRFGATLAERTADAARRGALRCYSVTLRGDKRGATHAACLRCGDAIEGTGLARTRAKNIAKHVEDCR